MDLSNLKNKINSNEISCVNLKKIGINASIKYISYINNDNGIN